jgi:tetratricopeptide (TPR) repeat protein
LIFIGDASAKNPKDEAAQLFQHKQYREALDKWYGLVHSGNVGAGIYYNIGLSESFLGQTPKSILACEKALRFKPSDKRINEALILERKKIESAIIPVPAFFLSSWINATLSLLRPGNWAMMGLVIFLIPLIWKIGYGHSALNKLYTKRWQVILTIAAGIFFLLCGWRAYRQIYRTDEAIVLAECIFRQAPSDDSPSLRTIYPGEKVIMSDQIGDWYQVRLLNLDEGWVKSESVELIIIDGDESVKE